MPLRVALPNASEIGRSFAASPDRFSMWGVAAISATLVAVWLIGPGIDLAGSSLTNLLCLALLLFGLPHGSLDIALIRRRARLGPWQVVTTVSVYLGFAAATYAIWKIAPVWALAGFLVVAIFHFAEDWADRLPAFFSTFSVLRTFDFSTLFCRLRQTARLILSLLLTACGAIFRKSRRAFRGLILKR